MLFYRRSVRERIGPVERAVCFALLALLVAIALWIRQRGANVREELFRLDEKALKTAAPAQPIYRRPGVQIGAVQEGPAADATAALLSEDLLGPDWKREGAVGVFGPENLYEKIDGREGLYKSYGFQRLWTATYASGDATVDVEVFLQGSPRDAFGVFSTERQGSTSSAAATADRLEFPNGMYLVRDSYYIRLVGSEASGNVSRAAREGAAKLSALGKAPAAQAPAGEQAASVEGAGSVRGPRSPAGPESWTPTDNPLVKLGAEPASLRYQAENGLGMDYFAGLYSGDFVEGATKVRGYVYPAPSPAKAKELFDRYVAYLRSQGQEVPAAGFPGAPDAAVAVHDKVLDTWEWSCLVGRFVIGVTESPDAAASAKIVARLAAGLQEIPPR